ncbi:DUF6081 family protein [Streptomyces flaveolus]|uniref:DUF6081 family protein n=1 Tax=Streptomyces flaveolus TaxID=67297 RepID=A0ABV3A176_9ACTN|nr:MULTISPECIES: DUF6081 family protein [Streptomyces]
MWRRAARADRPLRRPSRPDRQREGKDPLPDGTTFVADEPGANVTVGDGGVRIAVDRFTQSHPVQTADNCKFLVLSTEDFTLPEAGRLSFSASIAAEAINATPYDHRDGFAAFVLCDPVNGWVYDLCTSGETAFAITERLPYPGVTSPFTRVVSDPLYSPSAAPGQLHHCEITIDTAAGRVTWQLDGKTVHEQLVAELFAEPLSPPTRAEIWKKISMFGLNNLRYR